MLAYTIPIAGKGPPVAPCHVGPEGDEVSLDSRPRFSVMRRHGDQSLRALVDVLARDTEGLDKQPNDNVQLDPCLVDNDGDQAVQTLALYICQLTPRIPCSRSDLQSPS